MVGTSSGSMLLSLPIFRKHPRSKRTAVAISHPLLALAEIGAKRANIAAPTPKLRTQVPIRFAFKTPFDLHIASETPVRTIKHPSVNHTRMN